MRFELKEARLHCLGREPSCDLVINDPRISKRHAEFSVRTGGWECRDLGSKNGTRVEGDSPGQSKPGQSNPGRSGLDDGDWLDLGGLLAQFRLPDGSAETADRLRAASLRQTSLELGRRLGASRNLSALLDELLSAVMTLAGTGRAFVMLENASGEFEVVAVQGLSIPDLESAAFTGSLGIVRESVLGRKAVVHCDVAHLPEYRDRPSIATGAVRAVACLPFQVRAGCRGVIYTDSHVPGKYFDELDVDILEGFAERSAVALGAALLRESLDRVATRIDPAVSGVPSEPAVTLDSLLRAHAAPESASAESKRNV